jgi:tRNA nucleotidyltransferase (CCA-adding enzyme)
MTKFYQVGGSVRDKVMGVKSKDIDYAVETTSFDAMREAIIQLGGKIFVETPKFFTIRALVPDYGACDYTLCRRDGVYTDGRRPDSVEIGNLASDLARRDFTMNAIALEPITDTYIDPYQGLTDIENKLIRCVGDATQRFQEDKLRVFRAVRFVVTKDFSIENDTAFAIGEVHDFSGVSTERIIVELEKMFAVNLDKSLDLLMIAFPNLWSIILERHIGFKPTMPKTS